MMKILFLAARDSSNFAAIKIIKALENRGHEVLVYDKSLDNINIRMLVNHGIKVKYFDELTDDIVDSCDIMFCQTEYIGDKKINKKLYTFFFNYIYVYGHENASDFVFTQCDDDYNTFPNKVVFKIGSPKLDKIYHNGITLEQSNRILFIETGHFPFGEKGRKQVAELILAICNKCKDYTITVKPRFLPEDTKKLTRKNVDHIYTWLDKLCDKEKPNNLELLYEHKDLEELIYQSHSIICYGSSSYLEASLSGRGVIYVSGIDSIDTIGDRKNKYWKAFDEFIEDSGIVVPYEKVLDYLPDGIVCNEKHLNKALYSKENVSEKVAEVVDYVYEKFLKKGIYPKPSHYEYNNYTKTMQNIQYISKNALILNNKYDILVWFVQKCERSISTSISFEKMYQIIATWKSNGILEKESVTNLKKMIEIYLSDFIILNASNLMGDKIDESILLQKYFDSGRINEIKDKTPEDFIAKDAYFYYFGRYYCDNENPKGFEMLNNYFEYLKHISFEESDIYTSEALINAFISAFIYSAKIGNKEFEKYYIVLVKELEEKYKYDAVNYDMRCSRYCWKLKLYKETSMLVENWLTRRHDGIQKYRELELNSEAWRFKAEIEKLHGNFINAERYNQISDNIDKEKQNLASNSG